MAKGEGGRKRVEPAGNTEKGPVEEESRTTIFEKKNGSRTKAKKSGVGSKTSLSKKSQGFCPAGRKNSVNLKGRVGSHSFEQEVMTGEMNQNIHLLSKDKKGNCSGCASL